MTELGRAVEALREHAGFPSGNALARAAELRASIVNRVVNGETSTLHASSRTAIERATGAPPGTLGKVQAGELTAQDAVDLAEGRPLDAGQRQSVEWRLTQLEAAVSQIAERLARQDAG